MHACMHVVVDQRWSGSRVPSCVNRCTFSPRGRGPVSSCGQMETNCAVAQISGRLRSLIMRGHAKRRPSASATHRATPRAPRQPAMERASERASSHITSSRVCARRAVALKPPGAPLNTASGAPLPRQGRDLSKKETKHLLASSGRSRARVACVHRNSVGRRSAISKMNAPNSWLFADNSRYSTRARLVFMGLSFAIGILTFLLYLAIWYTCSRRSRRQRGPVADDLESGAAAGTERGMSDAAIAALPTFLYEQPDDDAAVDCAVCLGQLEAGEKARRLPKCAHLFHAECVDAWLRAHCTCPMCRAPVGPAAAASSKKDGTTATATPATTATAEALPPV
ncbi:uncharacterized protein LOC123439628 [Hordeum vulgare subsp. vulgare]|uniref:uncharacterized protein LOC123439628 n=1 Tax=Hordeum vulgare subsp. vulgare TaxID=112509 RepID=UPI001D1A4E74|nr:uncharacterized protein LOC123439628 [Hordeum vulgare subsp. vulgare]